jgi:transposase-like protein/IS1 family transposase
MITIVCGLMLLGLLGLSWLAWTWWRRWPPQVAAITASMQRLLRPRTPDDCPACREQAPGTTRAPRPCSPVRPWHEVKSRRGKPKRIATAGFACPAPICPYYRITDAQVHALVGDGRHGKHERIQSFRCQACGTTFSARRHTALYRLKTPSDRIAEVLTALAEGLDVAAATRVFGHRHATITRWVTRAGEHSATLHGRWFRNLYMPHLQLDELRTRLRRRALVLWLWVTVDPITKIIPVLYLGPRTQDAAHTVVHKLRQQLAPTCTPIFSSDGLNLYFYALTAHFGQWVEGVGRRTRQWQVAAELIYGQLKKTYQRRKVVRVTRLMRCGSYQALRTSLQGLGLSGTLNTAFVERVNLTLRRGIAALARRTWATAQMAPQLLAHLDWWRAYYHFARPHASLRVPLAQPSAGGGRRRPRRYRQRTPAMAAGLTGRRWSVRELLLLPLLPAAARAA